MKIYIVEYTLALQGWSKAPTLMAAQNKETAERLLKEQKQKIKSTIGGEWETMTIITNEDTDERYDVEVRGGGEPALRAVVEILECEMEEE